MTTTANLTAARAVLSTDWDENGTSSVYLPTWAAEALLVARGWTRDMAHRGHPWTSPDGDTYWMTNEALAVALLAEVVTR